MTKIGSFLLLGAIINLLIITLPQLIQVGWSNLLGIVLFVAATIAIGHYLGGSDPQTRITIALANSTRNAGLALMLVALHVEDSGLVLGEIAVIG